MYAPFIRGFWSLRQMSEKHWPPPAFVATTPFDGLITPATNSAVTPFAYLLF